MKIIYCIFVTSRLSIRSFFKQRDSMYLEFVLCRSFQVVLCLLQIISGCFLLTVGRFVLFLSCSRLFQVISGCFLLFVCYFKLFLAFCWQFQVISCSFQLVSIRFLLVVGRFQLFQVVLGCFRSFHILVCEHCMYTVSMCILCVYLHICIFYQCTCMHII